MEFVVSRQRLNVLRIGFLATSDSFHSPHGIRVFYSLLLTRLETLVEVSNRADVATARRGLCVVGSLLDHFLAGQTERSARVARLQGDPEKLANKAFYRAVMEMFLSIRHSTSRELFADKEEVVDRTPHISGVASHSDAGPSSQGTKRGPRKRQPKSAPKRKRSCKISATALLARDAPVVEVKGDKWIPGSAFWSFCGLGAVEKRQNGWCRHNCQECNEHAIRLCEQREKVQILCLTHNFPQSRTTGCSRGPTGCWFRGRSKRNKRADPVCPLDVEGVSFVSSYFLSLWYVLMFSCVQPASARRRKPLVAVSACPAPERNFDRA